ncbi:type-F conjugative transfer system protein TraW [Photobacterium damselae]|uniref:type-F conjugative transfer system protein TraW n=1 Tax=Photobacterium damselae TaxID=38293 RepID=UPI0030F44430
MKPWPLIAALLLSPPLHAKSLGVIAPTFDIIEIDMLDWINARLTHYQETGEMAAMEARFKEQVKQSVKRPAPVAGITPTANPTTFTVDPTLTLAADIKDNEGKVLFKKGLKINPFNAKTWPNGQALPHLQLSKQLVFLDGDDKRQLNFAKRYLANERAKAKPLPIKWVLINGEPETVFQFLGERIYFDQLGNITRQLKVKHVPSVAMQDGFAWKIQEFDVSNESLTLDK